jgi:sec-independent protein translocase protein TatC
MFSIAHIVIIFVVALVVFGPEKLPDLARNLGKVMGEFRRATGDLRSTFESHMRDLEREAELRKVRETTAAQAPNLPAAEVTGVAAENSIGGGSQTAALPLSTPEATATVDPADLVKDLPPPPGPYNPIGQTPLRLPNQKHPRLRRSSSNSKPRRFTRVNSLIPTQKKRAMSDPAQPDPAILPPVAEEAGGRMSFFDHLVDLRKRLINSAIAIAIGAGIGLALSKHFIAFIVQPMQEALRANHMEDRLYFTSPAGYMGLVINLGLYLGVVLAMPFVLYQIWLFVAPGLYKHERKAVAGFIFSSMVLFLTGIAFGYYVMLPQTLGFLIRFATDGPVKPLISINEYFDLILIVLVGLGVIFELPVLIFILSLFGIVTPKFLLKNFRYAMLVITVVAAVVTPTPDATTMLVFMAPMIVLYFLGVFVSYLVLRRKQAATADVEA